MYVDGEYRLNELEEAQETGFKAGYEDYHKGFDMRNPPYNFRTHGAASTKLCARWYTGYTNGQVTAHRHAFDRRRGH